jgi:predicted RNase H-like HicB family nuclease
MEHKYQIYIYWSTEDDAFIAEVPELAGCISYGQSYQEARANIETAIEEWVETAQKENRPIPVPRRGGR